MFSHSCSVFLDGQKMNDLLLHLQLMKQEFYQLYCEVHKCADAIPELSNMVSTVQAMGKFVESLIIYNYF